MPLGEGVTRTMFMLGSTFHGPLILGNAPFPSLPTLGVLCITKHMQIMRHSSGWVLIMLVDCANSSCFKKFTINEPLVMIIPKTTKNQPFP